ncbi:uncharacterized protein VTP21DRAFT_4106 [Calcarisporiella thermophila]|uniref:uncharacterized protein n=1 Tax=Calcarisporiella thermophila TaxID=911321 RepID=UPI003743C9BD
MKGHLLQSSSIGTVHADIQRVVLAGNTRENLHNPRTIVSLANSLSNDLLGSGIFKVPPRDERYVDRPRLMKHLDDVIENTKKNQSCNSITLCGLEGVGKSQLALEYCYRKMNEFRYIFWMPSENELSLQSAFVDVAQRFNLASKGAHIVDPGSILMRVVEWLQNNDDWLLVYDNADDFSLGNTSNPFYLQTKYFPQCRNGIILVTTRFRDKAHMTIPIYLEKYSMDNEEALKLLGKDSSAPYALELIKELGYLPLATDIAGASMRMDEDLSPEI